MDFDKLTHDFKGENRKQKLIFDEVLRRVEKGEKMEDFFFTDMQESFQKVQDIWTQICAHINN